MNDPLRGAVGATTVGVDVGGTKILAAVVDRQGRVLARHQRPTPAVARGAEVLVDDVVEAVASVASGSTPAGVGIAAAGLVDEPGARVVFAPHLAWRGEAVRADLSARLGVPVVMDNDANCAALAEVEHGAARGVGSALVITVGTGIGGAVVLGGRLWRGAHGMAGEFGHVQVEPGGRPCPCGGEGCWEQYCSGSEIARLAGCEPSSESGQALAAALEAGDGQVRAAYAQVGEWLGRGVAGLVASFDPELVVVGGGAVAAGDHLLAPARRVLARQLVGRGHRPLPELVRARLGAEAGVVGAAVLARG